VLLCGEQHVRVGEDREHAKRLVVLDEPHAPHVGRELEHLARALADLVALGTELQVGHDVLGVAVHLVPLLQRLDVHRANPCPLLPQRGRQVTADEPPCPRHDSELSGHAGPRFPRVKTAREALPDPWVRNAG
jgi:hypothetical protein